MELLVGISGAARSFKQKTEGKERDDGSRKEIP